jgi:hypothetical protein
MSLGVDCHELEVMPNLILLAAYCSLDGVCRVLDTEFRYKLEGASCDQNFLLKSCLQIDYENLMSLKRGRSLTKFLPSGIYFFHSPFIIQLATD